MGAFKEEAYVFENIARKQKQIYKDSCDLGYPYDKSNIPSEITKLFETIKELQKLDKQFPEEKPLIRNRETWANGVSVTIRIAWEIDEGYEYGTQYVITYNKVKCHSLINKTWDAYVSIDIENYREK